MNKKLNLILTALMILSMVDASAEISVKAVQEVFVTSADCPLTKNAVLENYSAKSGGVEPIVFRGAGNHLKNNFSAISLVHNHGREMVKPLVSSQNHSTNLGQFIESSQSGKNNDYYISLNMGECSDPSYAMAGEVPHDFFGNGLSPLEEHSLPSMSGEGINVQVLLIGHATHTPLHSHGAVFLHQVEGTKTLIAVPEKYAHLLECMRYSNNYYQICQHDIYSDRELLESLEDFTIWQITINPGDVVYIPDGWLHDLKTEGFSISLAHGFEG